MHTQIGLNMALTFTPNAHNIKEVNAIMTRSGIIQEDPSKSTTHVATSRNKEDLPTNEVKKNIPVQVPFPQALHSTGKVSENHGEILEHLKQVKINLPLLHVIKQVLTYAKVIKDLFIMKRKHHVKKTAFLMEQVSMVIKQKTPPKYKDFGCLTISCQIGTYEFGQALLDLGASFNLMPYSIYFQLGPGEIKPTPVVLQLADRSIKNHRK